MGKTLCRGILLNLSGDAVFRDLEFGGFLELCCSESSDIFT